jgi:hypothetical protein
MWQIIIVTVAVAVALVYVVRSLVRSAKGEDCRCGTGACSLSQDRKDTSLPCQSISPAVSANSLEESARNLAKPPASHTESVSG